jgi:hypothetical protein
MHDVGRRFEKSEIQKRRRKSLKIVRIGEKSEGLGHWPPHNLDALEDSDFHLSERIGIATLEQPPDRNARKLCRYPRVVYLCRLKSQENSTKSGK